jgi:tetratricopeptide (TPR) repeat protein
MPVQMLLEQLEHSLDILTGGSRDLPARQRTMRDTVAWSEGLLEPYQRTLFQELSVFAGGWTLDAAMTVTSAATNVLDPMSALLDKSLIRRSDDRYSMLDVIREFAAESLGDPDAVRARHASYFHALALETEPEIGTSSQRDAIEKLALDQDNLRAALRSFIENGDAERSLQMAAALWQFWRVHGDLTEGRDWFSRGLALEGGTLPTRAKGLWGAAWLAYHQGDYDDANAIGESLGTLAATTDDPVVRRNALTVSGIIAMAQSRFADARAMFEQAVALLRPLGQNWLFATSLLNLGSSCVRVRDKQSAQVYLEAARDLYDRLGDRHFAARASIQLGFAAMIDDDFARAASLISPALSSFAALDDPWGIAESLEALAAVRAADGRAEMAAILGGAAEQVRSTITVRPHPFDASWMEPFMEAARASIDDETWQRWWDGGIADVNAAIELGLSDSPVSA